MTAPVAPSSGRLQPLGLSEVRISGGFWGERQQVNGSASLGHALGWVERAGWVENFRAAADGNASARKGREFSDSEIYKLLEAVAWESARAGSTPAGAEDLVATVGRAQEADGYLNTAFGRPAQPARYSNLEWGHELYCYGHLIHAGVAHGRAGAPELQDIAVRAADHVCDTFGAKGNDGLCGHAGIEMALVELARATGEQRYLDQARLFVERRGRGRLADVEFGRAYYQDDIPVRDAATMRGHAVRALYLASGAVDVAVETGDDALLDAVITQWESAVAHRTYLTGGMGSRHSGEAFGDDYELPPDRAYAETCAGVASVMLSWRLLLATGETRFADLAERTLFNIVATCPAEDGRSFFYTNTLHQRHNDDIPDPHRAHPRPTGSVRAPWRSVSCCPTNVARLLSSLGGYLASKDSGGIQIHQYADADVDAMLDDGRSVTLRMRTDYPHDGTVTVEVVDAPDSPVTVTFRVPPWARSNATVTGPDGTEHSTAGASTLAVSRTFRAGDRIRLDIPVEPRWTAADPRIDAIRGTVAMEHGPLVLCAESTDLPDGVHIDALQVDPEGAPVVDGDHVVVPGTLTKAPDAAWPYQDLSAGRAMSRYPAPIRLVPYYRWANRGPSTMRVWLPT